MKFLRYLLYVIGSVILFLLCTVLWYKCTTHQQMIAAHQENVGDAEAYYEEYCASCHGSKVREFVERDKWVYGSSRTEMFTVIKDGADVDGMPAYGEVLDDQQIYELVDYIMAAIEDKKQEDFNSGDNNDVVFKSEGMNLKLELVADHMDSPWGITQDSSGILYYTDKSGQLFSNDLKGNHKQIEGTPTVKYRGQGGMMDVCLHPNFKENKRIYLTYSKPHPNDEGLSTTALFSGVLENGKIKDGKDIFIAMPYETTSRHFGSRLVFDNDGYMFLSVGERGRRDDYPQKLDNHLGKILRMNDDGTPVPSNPFYNQEGAMKEIYSYGHRNPQGLCYNPDSNLLYDHEHGPRGGDEINLVKAGENYGWPVITYGINYVGTKITDITHKEGMLQPERYWVPSIAPCGMDIITSDRYPAWNGDILTGSLKFNYMHRDVFDENGKWVKEEKLFPNIGRFRSIEQCADGYIYFGVEDPGKIYRIKSEY